MLLRLQFILTYSDARWSEFVSREAAVAVPLWRPIDYANVNLSVSTCLHINCICSAPVYVFFCMCIRSVLCTPVLNYIESTCCSRMHKCWSRCRSLFHRLRFSMRLRACSCRATDDWPEALRHIHHVIIIFGAKFKNWTFECVPFSLTID